MADIRQTGPVGLRGLRGINKQKDISEMSLDEQWKSINSIPRESYSAAPEESVGLAAMQAGYGNSQYDEGITSASQFGDIGDIRYANQPWYDTLANGIGKMLGTAGTTFVSSLVGLPYGLYQVGKSAAEGDTRWSALWDNDVTQGLSDVDKWLEENMTNYRSQVQQNSPWYSSENLMSMNFIADDVIKNMGFTLGAAASMAVGSGSLGLMSKALGFVNNVSKGTKMGQAALSALFSATGEGMIEARQGVEERNKLEMQRLEDSLAPEYSALQMQQQDVEQAYAATGDYGTYRQRMQDIAYQKEMLDARKAAGQQQIIESGQEMGNTILLANQGLLTLGNLIQFGKGMVKGFDKARHAAEISSKSVKPFGVTAERVSNNIKDGYRITGKNFGKTIAATKGILTEGSEEMNQQWAQSSSGAYYTEKDVNDYWKARLDPESYRETTQGLYTFGQALDRGFRESWGDKNQWEQFVIGGLTGMTGSYTPTKLFNQDKTKKAYDPRRYGSWEGGMYNEIKDFNREYNQYSENIDDLNKILQSEDFPARMRSMTGHTYTESEKTNAAEADDKKAFKDAEDKQFVHDVQAFLRAGKLDDLRAIYNEIGTETTDEDIQNVIKSTTKEISAEEDKQNFDRNIDEQIASHQKRITELQTQAQNIGESQEGLSITERADYQAAVTPALEDIFRQIDSEYDAIDNLNQQKQSYVGQKYYEGAYVDRQGNQTVSNDEIKKTIKHNSEELNRKLDSYLNSIAVVNEATKGALSKDQEDNLAYLHHLGRESLVRADKIISDKRKQMPSKFLMKTDKSPEQLTKEYASSDLVFSKDENTKDGYVEVDTSTMDDVSFRNFFVGQLLWGGNINPEFSETAEEKAAREEEEKNLSAEEKKKKARERLTKTWKEGLAKQKKDAEEQRDANGDLIAQHFVENYRKNNNANQMETQQALDDFFQDIVDASSLINQAGEYDRTLREYMANPNKVDEDKAKEEIKAQEAETKQQQKNKFEGKTSQEMTQNLNDGVFDFDELTAFANSDGKSFDNTLKQAQQEAKKTVEKRQKVNALKNHVNEALGNNPTEEELKDAGRALQALSDNELTASDASEINLNAPELTNAQLDTFDPTASLEDLEAANTRMQDLLAEAFGAFEEDLNAQDDIPEAAPTGAFDGVETPTTGKDETTKTTPTVVAPSVSSSSKAANEITPKNPLTEGALDNIIKETSSVTTQPNTNGTWRSTTTRHPYGDSTGTYHENLTDKEGVRYKRSKAIWEYLNREGAFNKVENASTDRIKPKDTIHFMVKYFPEIFGVEFRELSDENKPYALAIIMLNDDGEVLGDLPLAQFEKGYGEQKAGSPLSLLVSIQDRVFKAFDENYKKTGNNEAVVDNKTKEGADNLNLTFEGTKKPLVSKIKQVMRGAVPYRKSEKNTLNEVVQGTPELAVKVSSTNVGVKRGDKNTHKDIVIPKVGSIGQPYLLLPTASGEKIAVPFYMPAFNAEQHRNTELYNQLTRALFYMLTTNGNSKQDLDNFGKHMDVIEGLLQVKRQEGAKRIMKVDLNNKTVTLHLQSLTDATQKIDISVPYSDDFNAVARTLADKLSGIPINVSLQYLNDDIQTGIGNGAIRKVSYNQIIGEIADVNLPKATKHTVNSWFTIELTTQAGTKPSKAVTSKNNGRFSDIVGGRLIEVDGDMLIAYDPVTGEIITDNEDINLYLAEMKSKKPLYKDKDFIQISIGGEVRTYDVKNKKFTKNPSKPASNRRDFVKEIAAAKTTQDLISIQQAFIQAQADGTISADDMVKLSGYVNQKRASLNEKPADASKSAIGFTQEAPKPVENKPKSKTIEEIESEAKQKKIVTRQTKDAWDAIPDELKLKLFNEGAYLNLNYREGYPSYQVSLSDRENLIRILADANMAAKSGKLKISEAAKPMEKNGITLSREKEQEARRWLAKNLPSLSSEERTQFVEKLARMGDNASKAWGSYRSGVIQIQRNAPMGTVYHEAFHYVMDMLLDPEEKKMLLDIAKQEYGISDDLAAEERLANDFRRYSLDENTEGIVGRIKRWIRKIMDKMNRYNRISDATINNLFWRINNGEFAEKSEYVENFEDNQQAVLREIRNIQKENLAWNSLSSDTKAALSDSHLSEAAYNEMSLEEKEQYVRCRG